MVKYSLNKVNATPFEMRLACLLVLFMSAGLASAMACTNLIVGKKASKDGSVMCSYNCDGF